MKNVQKVMMFTMLIISAQSLFAGFTKPNKQQIFLTNNYGDDVDVNLTWESKDYFSFSRSQTIMLRDDDKELMIKAPFSGYKLTNIQAAPQVHMQEDAMDEDPSYEHDPYSYDSNRYAQTTSYAAEPTNTDKLDQLRIGDYTYFVIESSGKKIATTGEDKIRIKGFSKKDHEATRAPYKSLPTHKPLPKDHLPLAHDTYASDWPLY